ncbi:MAG TPA: YCF48-related protein [Bacteroidia bacterium]|nr:YCF48-related protein [Bacteroidia bacterium]
MLKTLFSLLALTLPLTLFSQWTNLGLQSRPLEMTSDYHGIRISNAPAPIPGNRSIWTAYTTDDDWVTGTQRSSSGGGSNGCCTVEALEFLNDTVGCIAVNDSGTCRVQCSADAGGSWQSLMGQTSGGIADLQAFSDTVAYLIGHGASGFSTLAMRLSPSGYVPVFVSATHEGNLGRIHFVNDSLGFVIARDMADIHKVFRTTDGGLTWSTRLSVGIGELRAIHFVDERTGFVAGESGVCYKTTDGGFTWNSLAINGPVDVFAMDFLTDQIGYLACGGGVILRTTNGGQNWANDQLDSSSTLIAVKAVTATIAYVLTSDSVLYKRNYVVGEEEMAGNALAAYVYPNPANELLHIVLPSTDQLRQWRLRNVQGQLLRQGATLQLDLGDVPDGVYFLELDTRLGTQWMRVLHEF